METLPWYKSAILRQQVVQLLVAGTAIFGVQTGTIDLDATVASIFAGIAGVIALWTFVTRLVKPSPNLTATAAAKEDELRQAGKLPGQQGGFFRVGAAVFAFVLASIAALTFGALCGCAGTQAAYKAAQSLPDTAYVVAEHYAAVVHEAAGIAALPGTPAEVKDALKKADQAVKPIILGNPDTGLPGLRTLAERYQAVKSAENEAALQAALNDAVRELANFINAVKTARR
jgi:hypothetical protein